MDKMEVRVSETREQRDMYGEQKKVWKVYVGWIRGEQVGNKIFRCSV